MHPQSSTVAVANPVLAAMPLAGKLRPATTVCQGLSYARVSRSIQTTIPGQQERIARLARKWHVPIVRTLEDTGSGMRRDRDGYQELLTEAETGHYSHVFLFKADRLARDSAELQMTVKRLWRLGIKVVDTSVDEITPQNLPVLAMLAEMEIRNLSERVDMALEQHAAEGSKIGGIPIGYRPSGRKGHPVKDRELAPHVTELFERAASGQGLHELATWFTQATARRADRQMVRRILTNPYYIGVTVNFRRRQSLLLGDYARPREDWKDTTHDQPLTDNETWERVQAQLARARYVGQHRAKASDYALQGLLWCGRCERRMYGKTKTNKGVNYCCHICHVERGRRKVERAVLTAMARLRLHSGEAADVLRAQLLQERSVLARELTERGHAMLALTKRRMRLYERLDEGTIDEEQYKSQVANLDMERSAVADEEAALRAKLAAAPDTERLAADIASKHADWLHWPERVPELTVIEQQKVYRECCKRITLDAVSNHVTVAYTDHIALLIGAPWHTEAL